VAMQDDNVSRRMQWVFEGFDHILPALVNALDRLEVLCKRSSCASQAILVQHSGIEKGSQNCRCAAYFVQVVHNASPTGLEIGQVRDLGAESVEVAECPFDLGFPSDGHQVQHGIGRAAQGEYQSVSVLKRFTVDNVARANVLFDKPDQGFAGEKCFALL